MKNLYINTCKTDIIIKLFDNNKILREETIVGQQNNSQFIMPTIKKVLDTDKPESIIVVNGPGSFTGVRLGVTVAKTFAYILNIPIRTITTLEEMAFSVNEEKEIFAVQESKGFYVGIFDKKDNIIGEYKYLTIEEYKDFTTKYEVKTDVTIDYSKVIKEVLKKDSVNAHSVKPIYVKLIEVEKVDKKS